MKSFVYVLALALLAADPSAAICNRLYTDVDGYCFRFMASETLKWSEAQSRCDVIGGHLVVIDDCAKFSRITTYINLHGNYPTSGGFWIGGTDVLDEGEFVWITGDRPAVALGNPFWGSENGIREPSGGIDQNCVVILESDSYHFHDVACDQVYGVLCEQDEAVTNTSVVTTTPTTTPTTTTTTPTTTTTIPTTSHPDNTPTGWWYETFSSALLTTGWWFTTPNPTPTTAPTPTTTSWPVTCPVGYTKFDDRCFLFLTDSVQSWTQAIATCSLNGGQLARVDTCSILGDLATYITNYAFSPNGGYWVGISDVDIEGIYKFIDGTTALLTPPFWGQTNGDAEPNGGFTENCIGMSAADDFYFHDENCTRLMAALCEAAPQTPLLY